MLLQILNKVLVMLFFLSTTNIVRHIYFFIQTLMSSTEENQLKYKLKDKSLFLLAASIAFVLMSIFTGIKL